MTVSKNSRGYSQYHLAVAGGSLAVSKERTTSCEPCEKRQVLVRFL